MPDPLETILESLGPKKMTGDEGSVEERSVKELIEADRYLQQQTRPTTPPYGLKVAQLRFQSTQS